MAGSGSPPGAASSSLVPEVRSERRELWQGVESKVPDVDEAQFGIGPFREVGAGAGLCEKKGVCCDPWREALEECAGA